jgi:hypothetical protein
MQVLIDKMLPVNTCNVFCIAALQALAPITCSGSVSDSKILLCGWLSVVHSSTSAGAERDPSLTHAMCVVHACRFGGFGSDYCSGNTQEMWRDRSEFVRLAGQRAAQHFTGNTCACIL